jgi:8-oxo-dGTP pyrophosphatase MutT (NUDIX family)
MEPMSVGTDEIRILVEKYLAEYPDEIDRLARLSAALAAPEEATGHVTSAAALIDPRWRVLHIHYPSRGRWVLPGGHLTPEDDALPDAALREVRERTGIDPETLAPLPGFEVTPIDIDVHRRPARRTTGRPEHWHFELRHAFRLGGSPTVRLHPDDLGQPAWLGPEAVPGFALRLKLRALHRTLVVV